MRACEKMLPEVLVLNDRIKTVALEYRLVCGHKDIVYTKGHINKEGDLNVQEILITEGDGTPSSIRVYFLQNGCKRIILPLENESCAKSQENIAKLFIWFPLLGTEEWGTNFIYHSLFYPFFNLFRFCGKTQSGLYVKVGITFMQGCIRLRHRTFV